MAMMILFQLSSLYNILICNNYLRNKLTENNNNYYYYT